jgi:hypothetical protein
MRVESAVTSITWIPSEAISGMPKLPFEMGMAHYDEPPPDRIDDLDPLHENDLFREANELKAWIEVEDDKVVDQGYSGTGRIGVTRIKLGPREVAFAAVQYPLLQAEPEVGDGWVKFVQSAGGHMGLPAPRRVSGKPFFRVKSASAWTTLQLIVYADGSSNHSLLGASPFPRHWIYDDAGQLVEKSGVIDFGKWFNHAFGDRTPWGETDSPAVVAEVESALERSLSSSIMRGDVKPKVRSIAKGEALVTQGEPGSDVYLILDGIFVVEVDGNAVAEIGPGAVVGERSGLVDGKRTATLRAQTAARVAGVPADALDTAALGTLAESHQREG